MEIESLELNERSEVKLTDIDTPLSAEEKDQLDRVKKVAATNINLGLTAINLGTKFEAYRRKEINNHIQDASELQKTIQLLVDLNGKLSLHKDNENEKPITPEIREICDQLKAKKIDVLSEKETTLTKERLAEIKANVSSHTDRLKTDLQILFTAKLQVCIQELQTILDTLKRIEESSRSTRIIANMKAGG